MTPLEAVEDQRYMANRAATIKLLSEHATETKAKAKTESKFRIL